LAPIEDAQRWNSRYREQQRYTFEKPRPFLIEHQALLPSAGRALDAAMGLGGNTSLLLQRGLQVVGVDISFVAAHKAKASNPGLMAVVADLTSFSLPDSWFHLIINFFYLERALWDKFKRALRPGGLLVFETLTVEMLEVHPDIDPAYLLMPGELAEAFQDMDILVYREGWSGSEGHRRATAGMVARTKKAAC
jgi:tellurite methyltransferase